MFQGWVSTPQTVLCYYRLKPAFSYYIFEFWSATPTFIVYNKYNVMLIYKLILWVRASVSFRYLQKMLSIELSQCFLQNLFTSLLNLNKTGDINLFEYESPYLPALQQNDTIE